MSKLTNSQWRKSNSQEENGEQMRKQIREAINWQIIKTE